MWLPAATENGLHSHLGHVSISIVGCHFLHATCACCTPLGGDACGDGRLCSLGQLDCCLGVQLQQNTAGMRQLAQAKGTLYQPGTHPEKTLLHRKGCVKGTRTKGKANAQEELGAEQTGGKNWNNWNNNCSSPVCTQRASRGHGPTAHEQAHEDNRKGRCARPRCIKMQSEGTRTCQGRCASQAACSEGLYFAHLLPSLQHK